jgi:Tfp pilus assembly protein PilX
MRIVSVNNIGHKNSGAVLPVILLLALIRSLLAVSALRTATAENRFIGALIAANEAFWLAETGLQYALNMADSNPGLLTSAGVIALPRQTLATGTVDTTIAFLGTAAGCPELADPSATREHFEIRADSHALRNAVDSHMLGFYICRDNCLGELCTGIETAAIRTYWKTTSGGSGN